jgi:hypothetical protein
MKKEQILGIIRHALTFVGGVLITKGVIDEASFVEISGALLTLIETVWSVVNKNS